MIAGDLTEVRKFHYFVPFLESVIADNGFDRVFYVMGNHEYYGDALHKVVWTDSGGSGRQPDAESAHEHPA